MNAFIKTFAAITLLISVSIILEELSIFTLNTGISKILIGAILILALQIFNIIALKEHNGHIGIMNTIMIIVFLLPVIAYFFSGVISFGFMDSLPLIIGVMMLLESLYMLH